jgi:mannose-6-phosphate isomerase-like protein (cupin superfamily)
MDDKVNLAQKLGTFMEPFRPKIVDRVNDYDIQVVKARGEFVWHKHDDTDDFFLVLKGRLTIQLRDRNVELREGKLFVVPRGVEHCPRADEEAHILLIEPVGTPNTGDTGGPLTARKQLIGSAGREGGRGGDRKAPDRFPPDRTRRERAAGIRLDPEVFTTV